MTDATRRFDLVIFDCDGVVVDSESISDEVFEDFIRPLGVDLPLAKRHELFLGRRLAECVAIVEGLTGRPVPAEALDRYRAERDRAMRERVRPIAGIRAVLEGLAVPYCIASSGEHSKMQATLGSTGLMPLFAGRIFSATEVARGKPAPDIFLYAAEKMGASPGRTAVIEDSVNGVLAARAAGMTVFAFAGLVDAERLAAAGAHVVFTRMPDLPPLLE
jgi:HAD superfamily hydrolase (TIGR01509 family)